MDGVPVAVVEGGVVYYVRTDHIGRPVFATDGTGAKVWEATYLPFGEVLATAGNPIALRFPGQWFQAESGLHQNWMRDYDPTTGRYMQADPLGLVDGASVYGYARQNPARYVDSKGLASCTYYVSTHTLTCVSYEDGTWISLDPDLVHSGRGTCKNNTACSGIEDEGPTPPSAYNMQRVDNYGGSYWLDEGSFQRRVLGGVEGRSGFFLHQGTFSMGCITVKSGDPSWQNLMNFLDSYQINTMRVMD